MIRSFAGRETERLFADEAVRRLPPQLQRAARRKLLLLDQARRVEDLRAPPRRIKEIVLEKRGLSADPALRLARYFGATAELWAGLQADYDLRLARCEKERQIERDVEPLASVRLATA